MRELLTINHPSRLTDEASRRIQQQFAEACKGTRFDGASIVLLEEGMDIKLIGPGCSTEEIGIGADLLEENGFHALAQWIRSFAEPE